MIASERSGAKPNVVVSQPATPESPPEGRSGVLPFFFAIAPLAAGYWLAARYLPHLEHPRAGIARDGATPVEVAKNDMPPVEPVTPVEPVKLPVEKIPEVKPPEVKAP